MGSARFPMSTWRCWRWMAPSASCGTRTSKTRAIIAGGSASCGIRNHELHALRNDVGFPIVAGKQGIGLVVADEAAGGLGDPQPAADAIADIGQVTEHRRPRADLDFRVEQLVVARADRIEKVLHVRRGVFAGC